MTGPARSIRQRSLRPLLSDRRIYSAALARSPAGLDRAVGRPPPKREPAFVSPVDGLRSPCPPRSVGQKARHSRADTGRPLILVNLSHHASALPWPKAPEAQGQAISGKFLPNVIARAWGNPRRAQNRKIMVASGRPSNTARLGWPRSYERPQAQHRGARPRDQPQSQ
jgi:hypothetical protein